MVLALEPFGTLNRWFLGRARISVSWPVKLSLIIVYAFVTHGLDFTIAGPGEVALLGQ